METDDNVSVRKFLFVRTLTDDEKEDDGTTTDKQTHKSKPTKRKRTRHRRPSRSASPTESHANSNTDTNPTNTAFMRAQMRFQQQTQQQINQISQFQRDSLQAIHQTHTTMGNIMQTMVDNRNNNQDTRTIQEKERDKEYVKQIEKKRVTKDLQFSCKRKLGAKANDDDQSQIWTLEWFLEVFVFLDQSEIQRYDKPFTIRIIAEEGLTNTLLQQYRDIVRDEGEFQEFDKFAIWCLEQQHVEPEIIITLQRQFYNIQLRPYAPAHKLLKPFKRIINLVNLVHTITADESRFYWNEPEEELVAAAYYKLPNTISKDAEKVCLVKSDSLPMTWSQLQAIVDKVKKKHDKKRKSQFNSAGQKENNKSNHDIVGKQINAMRQRNFGRRYRGRRNYRGRGGYRGNRGRRRYNRRGYQNFGNRNGNYYQNKYDQNRSGRGGNTGQYRGRSSRGRGRGRSRGRRRSNGGRIGTARTRIDVRKENLSYNRNKCWNCGQPGHFSTGCHKLNDKQKKDFENRAINEFRNGEKKQAFVTQHAPDEQQQKPKKKKKKKKKKAKQGKGEQSTADHGSASSTAPTNSTAPSNLGIPVVSRHKNDKGNNVYIPDNVNSSKLAAAIAQLTSPRKH